MKRRTTLKIMAGLSGLALVGLGETWNTSVQANPGNQNRDRALASYNAMQKYFYKTDGSSLYLDQYPAAPEDRPYAFEWAFSQAHIATMDIADMPGSEDGAYRSALADRSIGQEHYWNPTSKNGFSGYESYPRAPYGEGSDLYYDDNEWVGHAKMRQYRANKDPLTLHRAKEIFALVVSAWDTDPSHPAPGGVFWTQWEAWNTDRNTVSNMPGAQLGLRLYQATGKLDYLSWSRKMYDWTNEHMLAPNGLFWDHIDLAGTIDKTHWSYNQGVPVGVNMLFFEVTRDVNHLRRAEDIAKAALAFYATDNRLYDQPVYFNAMFFKNLLLLESVKPSQRYVRAMQEYADRVWDSNRDEATGLFRFGTSTRTLLLEQAAMVQIYAALAWSPTIYGNVY